MEIQEISITDFKISDYRDKNTVFEFNNKYYSLILSDLQEIRMSVYVYFNVKFLENNKLILSGEMYEPNRYFEPTSPNNEFVYLPLKGNEEIINLKTKQRFISSVAWFSGNIFNQSSTKMIINGANEFKVIDLLQMKEIFHFSQEKDYLNDAFFVDDNLIWRFDKDGDIVELDLNNQVQQFAEIELPFDKFGIDSVKYHGLIRKKTYCLALPSNGMAFSSRLNNWNYINSKEKVVFETLIPISDIKYSKGYKTDYCDVEYKYVELTNRLPMKYKEKKNKIIENNKDNFWLKLKRFWNWT